MMQRYSIVSTRFVLLALPLLALGCANSEPQAGASAAAESRVEAAPAAGSSPGSAVQLASAEMPVVHVYKSPTCGCCTDWVTHMEEAGFRTEVQDMHDVAPIKARAGVPGHLHSCHTSLIGDYVVEGHVPADVIRRLLAEKPNVTGIAVPGMPMGSPGMEGPYRDRYDIVAFRHGGGQYVYDSR